jgi:hypothetical protein
MADNQAGTGIRRDSRRRGVADGCGEGILAGFPAEGPRTASDVIAYSAGGMISDKTLRRAASALGVNIAQENRVWVWSLGPAKISDGQPIQAP